MVTEVTGVTGLTGLTGQRELNLKKTFECGQCFRWEQNDDDVWRGVVNGRAAKLWMQSGQIRMISSGDSAMWHDYFDLERDYSALKFENGGEFFDRCVSYGEGIRILRQDAWETLCSFIISQCNNIPRIKKIVDTLCKAFGERFEFDGEQFFAFPDADKISALEPEDLNVLRCGYRAPYIIGAARAVASGELDLDALTENGCRSEALSALKKLNGVGDKVANCVILYGLNIMSGFPVDTWMRRALKEHFPPGFDPKSLGSCAGIAQQYIFYYARENHLTRHVI